MYIEDWRSARVRLLDLLLEVPELRLEQIMYSHSKQFVLSALIVGTLSVAACDSAPTQSAASPTPHSPVLPYASPSQVSPEDKMPRIRAEIAIKELETNDAVIIDVRGTSTFQQEHIKGAIDFPLDRLNQGDFAGLPRDKKIIAYCT